VLGIAVLGALLTMLAGARAWDLVSANVPSPPLPPAEATATRTPTPTLTATYTPPPCGLAWRVVPSPNFSGEYNNLDGIAATSPNDVWAVGYHSRVPLIARWDGTEWSVQPHGLSCCGLRDVSIISDKDIWAV